MKKINKHKLNGMSLIELLTAITIGLMLMAGAVSLFVTNKRVFRETGQMGYLQENARFAIDQLTKDIRMAGFMGCHHDSSKVKNYIAGITPASGSLYDTAYGIEGINDNAVKWSPSNNTDVGTPGTGLGIRVSDTDGITVRYLSGEYWNVVEDNDKAGTASGYMASVSGVALVSTVNDHPNTGDAKNNFNPGEMLGISDCNAADIFQLTTSAPTTNGHIRHEAGGGAAGVFPGNTAGNFFQVYAAGAKVRRYHAVRYYIGEGSYGGPSLFRQTFRNVTTNSSGGAQNPESKIETQELLEGIENMQIMYGVDSNNDGAPDEYLVAGDTDLTNPDHWNDVVSVKIALLIRTVDQNFLDQADTGTYTLLGNTVDPADLNVRRRVYNVTIQLRNRIDRVI